MCVCIYVYIHMYVCIYIYIYIYIYLGVRPVSEIWVWIALGVAAGSLLATDFSIENLYILPSPWTISFFHRVSILKIGPKSRVAGLSNYLGLPQRCTRRGVHFQTMFSISWCKGVMCSKESAWVEPSKSLILTLMNTVSSHTAKLLIKILRTKILWVKIPKTLH